MAQSNQTLLERLQANGVEFVIIGDVCTVYYGVLIATIGLGICCRFDEPNLRKIERAVLDLHPIHRLTTAKLPLELTSELCSQLKNLFLRTDSGSLDCLSEVAGIGTYEEVHHHSVLAKLSFGEFLFLNFNALMKALRASGRGHDLEALKLLQVIQEKTRGNDRQPDI